MSKTAIVNIQVELHLPNKETRYAIEQARRGNGVKKFCSVDELVTELEN